MLIYHFGSREGVVAAIVASVEEQQRNVMQELASHVATPADLIRAVWRQVADPELRPFVRLFFEVLAAAMQRRPGTEGFLESLTEPWIVDGQQTAVRFGVDSSRTEMRLGVAVIRGLLIDVLATGSYDEASASLERFIDMWERTRQTEQSS
jgi:AcrR family transcriptional regulator